MFRIRHLLFASLPFGIAVACGDESFTSAGGDGGTGGTAGDGDVGGDGDGDAAGMGPGGASLGGFGGSPQPCDGACGDDTPICDEGLEECVQCLGDNDCTGTLEYCNDDGMCVGCTEEGHCTEAGALLCHPETELCSECITSTDCSEVDASRCDEAGSCTSCMEDADCEHLSDTPACDTEAGKCVECTSREHCPDGSTGDFFVCERTTNSCLDRVAGELGVCQECEYDDDCVEGQLCVEQVFPRPDGEVVGNFCTWRQDGRPATAAGSCVDDGRPFAAYGASMISVEGQVADMCVLATTSCPAFVQHREVIDGCEVPVDDDGACGVNGMTDGLCRLPEGSSNARCTYPCLSDEDCRMGSVCTSESYCSL